ncbi:MAG TPA: ATP-binding protein [Candidatus Saccharimonadales bacterium]|nr:ATP-binding protein [Candidatus Saccharimonadales bacterium]
MTHIIRDSSLNLKLIASFLCIAVLFSGAGYYEVGAIRHFNALFVDLIDNDFARLNALEDVELSSVKLRNERGDYQRVVTSHGADAAAQKAAVLTQANDLKSKLQAYLELIKTDNPNVSAQTIATITDQSNTIIKDTLAIVNGDTTTKTQNDLTAAQTEASQAIATAIVADKRGADREDSNIDHTVRNLNWSILGLAILPPIFAVVIGASIAAWLSRSLARLRAAANRIANGDFTQTIPATGHDEIGELGASFNRMAERLKDSYHRLALEKQRDAAMLESMGEGMIATDSHGTIVAVNKVAAQLLNFTDVNAAVGKPIHHVYELYDLDDKASKPLPAEQRPSFMALSSGKQVENVFGFYAPDKRKHQLNITANPVKLDGQVVGVITILRDVTKEKEVDRMKTEFISLASHQLRTPLSAIKWFSEMLVSGDAGQLQPEQLDFAKNIADSTERMIALVNALLNISRIESGRIMVDPKPTDLRELVSGITNDLKAKTEEKQQTLIISVHEDLPKINLDPRLIGQVYLNLLTNAVKYTPKGGEISVFISKKGDDVISQVTDNGYGIPKDQQGRIFEKFFRAANAVKVETDGTGLGLYLIKAVIESSGGKIWFKSEEGKGTTFWFSIPLSGMQRKEGEVTLDA